MDDEIPFLSRGVTHIAAIHQLKSLREPASPTATSLKSLSTPCSVTLGQGGYVSLRSFLPDSKVLKPIRAVVMNDNGSLIELVDVAEDQARRAATNQMPAVFCPPIAVFNSREGWQAREEDLYKGLAISRSNATSTPTKRAGSWRNCSGRQP